LILQMNTLEERLVLKEDRYDLHEELTYIQSFSSHLSQQVYRELDFMAEYLLGQSEHNLSNIRVMNRLKVMTEDKEAEINVLREMVTDLQRKRAVYIPIRDDVIDSAVADFVNTRTTELPFTREDHGVYVFGSKRVFVKLEQGRIISKDYLVRVGGGFMKIEDFLEVYTSQEIERIENRKKEDGNVQRNAILGKYAGNILSERTRGKIEVSPDKAVKWIKEAIGTPKFTQCVGVPKASPKKFTLSSRSPNRDKLRKIPSDDIEN